MKIQDKHYQSIWINAEGILQIIDQRFLPHRFVIEDILDVQSAAIAIREMHVRGAPLIGATAAYGVYLAVKEAAKAIDPIQYLAEAIEVLAATRPTAFDLFYALDRMKAAIAQADDFDRKIGLALAEAQKIAADSVEQCRMIGVHGLELIKKIAQNKGDDPVNILTHCNAGWLATVDYGTAISPIYHAHDMGINIHVWVDETRPRNQGARLTAFELLEHGIPHTVITDNTGGHLMQHGMVDTVIVGTDRTTRTGDVANKIGTYLKALAAMDNNIPFYVALPSSTIDWNLRDGIKEIPIEKRSEKEVRYINGWADGEIKSVLLTPEKSPAANYAFDTTPNRLVTALITERGVCAANEAGILALFPEKKKIDEGYIKFEAIWQQSPPFLSPKINKLNEYRQRLYEMNLIGAYDNGIGFGNISCLAQKGENSSFFITGSATGNIETLDNNHYSRVKTFNIDQNTLTCDGPVIASSESMSHGVIYQHCPEVKAVIHIHHLELWKKLMHQIPTTAKDASYGSPEMAYSIIDLLKNTNLRQAKAFVMQDHEEGIFTFGVSLEEAFEVLELLKKM